MMATEQAQFEERSEEGRGSTPRPDPTVLTTEALLREIAALRTLIGERITATETLFDTKIKLGREGGMALKELTEAKLADMRDLLQERYATQCVSADTPVLCTDLIWRPAGDLLVGDELIAFEEEADLSQGLRVGRRFCRSVVTANSLRRDSLLRVTTTHGNVRCNREHPFLARSKGEGWRWIHAENLTMGMKVMSACDPWEQDRSWESGWLAGFLDGEGCLRFDPNNNGRARISINQVMGPTADLMLDIFKKRFPYIKVYSQRPSHGDRWKPIVKLQLDRRADIMRLLGSVRPQRLMSNMDQVWENFPMRGNERGAIVTSIEAVGTGMIASLSTSTKTYIAGGFAMHNTKALDAAFLAQQAAVATSFDASEKAVAAALLAAEKAVDKANTANEKRFESVNEFRAQLNDMIRTLLSRTEADAKFAALDTRATDNKDAISVIVARLAGETGADTGVKESRNDSRANIAIAISVGMGLLTMLTMIIINAMHIAGH